MHELSKIIQAVNETNDPFVLATVVDVVGSSYRRPTARMLIYPDGRHIGSISGGCLERDLCKAAFDLTRNGPKLISFDTRQGSTNFNPRYNVGCSGIIYVLVEPITRDATCPLRVVHEALDANTSRTVATVYQSDIQDFGDLGTRFAKAEDVGVKGRGLDELSQQWTQVRSDGRPTCCDLSSATGSTRLLIETIHPAKPIWIFGAGDDAGPLAEMAWQLGRSVTVIDHRASLLTAERFPHANRICKPWHEATESLSPSANASAVLMTHSFDADKILLPQLVELGISYVGMLGPKSRAGKVLREVHAMGTLPPADSLNCISTPAGLDIGAATPAEIGLSILGEIVANENDRTGARLADRQAPIHDPVRHVLIDLATDNQATAKI